MTNTEVDDFFDKPVGGANRNEPPREKNTGRYMLPDPNNPSGRDTSWTRTTTIAKTLEDTYQLDLWSQRTVLQGIAARPDLYALAASTPATDRETLDKVAADAKAAAGAGAGANMGTALHAFTATLDRGEDVSSIPDAFRADITAYHQKLAELGIKPLPRYIERTGLNTDYGVAGTFDRVYQLPDGQLVIGDLKTQKTMDFGKASVAIQLAIYAHFTAIRDFEAGQYEAMPNVSKDFAIVVHLPVGKATATVYRVNLRQGYHGARLAMEAREFRANKTLLSPWVPGVEVKTVTNYTAQAGLAGTPSDGAVKAAEEIVNGASVDPEVVAAAQRIVERTHANLEAAHAAAQQPDATPASVMFAASGINAGPTAIDNASGDLLTRDQHIELLVKQSKPFLQNELRKLDPHANVSKYRNKLAAEIVDHQVARGVIQLADEHDDAPTPREVGEPEGPTGFDDTAAATIAAANAPEPPDPEPTVSTRAAVLEAVPPIKAEAMPNPFADPEPELADPREPYAARMRAAESKSELASIWEELVTAGLQNNELAAIGGERVKALHDAGKA